MEAICKAEYDPSVKAREQAEQTVKELTKQGKPLEFNAQMEAALLEARLRGEQAIQQAIFDRMREANILAEQRLTLIETAGMDVIKQIEGYYSQLMTEIDQDDFSSTRQQIPQLLEILKQFDAGSVEHGIYQQEIQDYRKRHNDLVMERFKGLHKRQMQLIESVVTGKEQINAHINMLVEKRMEQIGLTMQAQMQIALPSGQAMPQIKERKMITDQSE